MDSKIFRNQNLVFRNLVDVSAKKMGSLEEENPIHEEDVEEEEKSHPKFQCKSCNRLFPTFQAVGGHRSGRNRHLSGNRNNAKPAEVDRLRKKRRKAHICGVCGVEFQGGQALGGHMRIHRRSKSVSCSDESGGGRSDVLRLDLNLSPTDLCGDHLGFLNLTLGLGL